MDGPQQIASSGTIEDFAASVREAIVAASREMGRLIVQSTRERISIAYPPASVPGESPHRRTGELMNGVGFEVEAAFFGVETTISSSRGVDDPRVPQFLEFGTKKIGGPRPYMQPEFDKWEQQLPDVLPDLIRSNLKP